ncbi:hypothetical protein EON63_11730 [archaeon]|nr:MAG: hypothetical protein EON63_11730 [archaeon]
MAKSLPRTLSSLKEFEQVNLVKFINLRVPIPYITYHTPYIIHHSTCITNHAPSYFSLYVSGSPTVSINTLLMVGA